MRQHDVVYHRQIQIQLLRIHLETARDQLPVTLHATMQAEEAGYELFLTSDKNMRYQQNLSRRRIAIVVPGNQQWPDVRLHPDRIATAVDAAVPGSYAEVAIPHKD